MRRPVLIGSSSAALSLTQSRCLSGLLSLGEAQEDFGNGGVRVVDVLCTRCTLTRLGTVLRSLKPSMFRVFQPYSTRKDCDTSFLGRIIMHHCTVYTGVVLKCVCPPSFVALL